jgi:hypothetical protein
VSHFQGRDVAEMSPGERLSALAAILAIGYEKWTQIQQIELAEVRKAMAPCVHAANRPESRRWSEIK